MHDLGTGQTAQADGHDRGPLWRRSAFRSATSGWRDFVLRGFIRARRADGTGGPERICGANDGFARARVNDADDQPADRNSARSTEVAQEGAGAAAVAAEARRLHARLYHDPEEAELGAS